MLHVFKRHKAVASPFEAALVESGVPFRLFSADVSLRYRSIFGLLFGVYPRLAWFALRSAVRSLILSRPKPRAVVIGTDVEAIVFGVMRRLFSRRTVVVFETFIVTPRSGGIRQALHLRYFTCIAGLIDLGICHSSAEVKRYSAIFARGCRFAFVPFGTTIKDRDSLTRAARERAPVPGRDAIIIAAGRSSRDYPTLARAIEGLSCRLRIVCDIAGPVANVALSPQIEILRACFGAEYVKALADADAVVVPLAVDDISAGQMVLLQAAALARPVIITRTPTTEEYAVHDREALLVPIGDSAEMRAAILRLLEDGALRDRLGQAASERFDRLHSTQAYVRQLLQAVGEAVARKCAPAAAG